MAAVAAILLFGCGPSEYLYKHTFHIDNRSETAVSVSTAENAPLFTIAPGESAEVFSKSFECHQNAKNVDYFPDPNQKISWLETNKVKAGDTELTADLWQRKRWRLDSGLYYSNYTLEVTAEVVAELTPAPPAPEEPAE